MFGDYSSIDRAYSEIDQGQRNADDFEKALGQRIATFGPNCLNGADVTPNYVIPNMGPCKGLLRSVAAYRALLPTLHQDLGDVARIKTASKKRLDNIKADLDTAFDRQ